MLPFVGSGFACFHSVSETVHVAFAAHLELSLGPLRPADVAKERGQEVPNIDSNTAVPHSRQLRQHPFILLLQCLSRPSRVCRHRESDNDVFRPSQYSNIAGGTSVVICGFLRHLLHKPANFRHSLDYLIQGESQCCFPHYVSPSDL